MIVHDLDDMPNGTNASSAYRHIAAGAAMGEKSLTMGQFRDAFLWHLDQHGTTLAELVEGTGVSRDILNKLKARPASSTHAEAAVKIAAFYGKSLEQFMRREPTDREREFARLFDQLTRQERQVLLAQMRGIVAERTEDN